MAGRFSFAIMVALLAFGGIGAGAVRSRRARRVASGKERPVMKVVRLLQDMLAKLQEDMDNDKVVHDKFMCWCKQNDREKDQAIDQENQLIGQLQGTEEEVQAQIDELKNRRRSVMADLSSDQDALHKASVIRMDEAKDFKKTQIDLVEAIKAAKHAIIVLSKHHPELIELRQAAKPFMDGPVAALVAAKGQVGSADLATLKEFLANVNTATSFLDIPGFQSYKPQSGQIFGILKQMLADFEASLREAEDGEAKAVEEFTSLKRAKEQQIKSSHDALYQIDNLLADHGETYAEAFSEERATKEQLGLDSDFIVKLRAMCKKARLEYGIRKKNRLEEIAAVTDTISILNTDKAFDQFDKTVNSFLQTASLEQDQRKARAAAVLQRAAQEESAPRLALLAVSAKLDGFEKVIAAIDKMAAELKVQQKDEVERQDWCKEEFAENERATKELYENKEALQVKMADIEKEIKYLGKEITHTTESMKEVQEQMKRASEVREGENADYQQTVLDQRITQSILAKALDRMKQVYAMVQEENSGEEEQPAHMELSGTDSDPGAGVARFANNDSKHRGGSQVVQMLETIIADSKKAEEEALAAEADAQGAYESLMKDSNKEITAGSKKLNEMQGSIAKAKASLSMAKTDLKQTVMDLEGLNDVLADLHRSCDFLMKNFDARQEARAAEMDALKEAKAILSGMKSD